MLLATRVRTSGVKTPEFPVLFGTANQAAEKTLKRFSSEAEAHWFRERYAGAEAPPS